MTTWLRDDDGTFFRNANCVEADIRSLRRRRFVWRRREKLRDLESEWHRLWAARPTRKSTLGRGDIAYAPLPLRVAYPNYPGLWVLDDMRT